VSRVIPYGWTERERESERDMMRPEVAFRNFADAPKTVNRSKFIY